ncbi:hypothetical protein EIN_253380 [Entamoeba invadens IP1]|uniref:B box-type domain-containing protein n=1 Tax=Entamoeba invadens IP1 TaxID=370355 RepID=A0A0A1UGR2_ENTIV|nr:hypothetical protein EIN_253380 [Entamoeba invadens IP1]ELP95074.1 hypothetical protein EIN_253380 [Entamoeba invadens IP1]|eukprot:XP_004261845.1 hypothetical protein EIN_253380 [Entamoeba invadens IP1]
MLLIPNFKVIRFFHVNCKRLTKVMSFQTEKAVCCCCGTGFRIPAFPKLLPCMHLICRDCLFSIVKSQVEKGVGKSKEVFCCLCQKEVSVPFSDLDDLPTLFSLIRESASKTICSEPNCTRQGFSFCLTCSKIYCESHTEIHYEQNSHKFEVFCEGKFCIKHHTVKTYFCCTCSEIICPHCFVLEHAGHIVCKYSHFLSKFYTSERFNITKRLFNLSRVVRSATLIYDSLYYYQQQQTENQMKTISKKVDIILEEKLGKLRDGKKHLIDIDKIIKEVSDELCVVSPPCPSFCYIQSQTNYIPLKSSIPVEIILKDVYENPSITSDITITFVPVSHILPGCVDFFEEMAHDISDDTCGDGGEASAYFDKTEIGKISVIVKGESEGDVAMRVYVHRVEIENSPLILQIQSSEID